MELVKLVPQHVLPPFMQLKGPLTCSQEPYTSSYPEPHELSTLPVYVFKIHFNILHLCLHLLQVFF